jgi:hypothetical protein
LLAKIGRVTLLEVHLELAIITVLFARLKRQVREIAVALIPFPNYETRDSSVVSTVEKVIGDWFSLVPNGSMLKAIQQFDLEKEEDGIRQLLFGLFRCQNYSLENDYQLEYISEVSTFLWLTYLEYVKQHGSVSLIGTFIYLVLIPSLLIAG